MDPTVQTGWIAQDFADLMTKYDAEYLNLVIKDNPDKLEATPNIIPILVKAVQELSAKVKALEAR
jgi:hypothetical protein